MGLGDGELPQGEDGIGQGEGGAQPREAALRLGLAPLTARSVILSVLLGTHPARLQVRALIRLGDLFDISEGTIRVALSRMAADGELVADGGWYDLSPRFLSRQRRLDDGRRPAVKPWRGQWELVVAPSGLVGPARSELVSTMAELRLGALREGVWLRPANLRRPWPPDRIEGHDRFEVRPDGDPAALAARLWDLGDWSRQGADLLAALEGERLASRRFALAAAIARLLRTDPVLPPPLLPADWPGAALRRAYRSYETELSRLLRRTGD